jgi:hypothetical protein
MVKDLSRDDERRGTRRIMLGGSAVAAALFVGLLGWFATPHLLGTADNLGRPPSGADRGTAATTIGTGVPTQREAESAVAKSDPAGLEDRTGGRARNIKQSSQPVSLDQEKREKLLAVADAKGPKVDRPNFELMIGTAVPRQTELADLPAGGNRSAERILGKPVSDSREGPGRCGPAFAARRRNYCRRAEITSLAVHRSSGRTTIL